MRKSSYGSRRRNPGDDRLTALLNQLINDQSNTLLWEELLHVAHRAGLSVYIRGVPHTVYWALLIDVSPDHIDFLYRDRVGRIRTVKQVSLSQLPNLQIEVASEYPEHQWSDVDKEAAISYGLKLLQSGVISVPITIAEAQNLRDSYYYAAIPALERAWRSGGSAMVRGVALAALNQIRSNPSCHRCKRCGGCKSSLR